jgi:hypothetical protein
MKLTEFIEKLQTIAGQMGSHPLLDDALNIVGVFKMKSWIDKVGDHPAYTFNIFGTFLLLIFGIFLTCEHIPNAIKAKVAPRMVLIEHLNGLRK